MRRQPHVSWVHPAVKQYVLIAIPLMIGQSIVALDEAFMSIFGQTVGDGEQTHLLYARRTLLVPIGIIAQAASVAAYPFMARLFAEGKIKELNRTVDRSLRWQELGEENTGAPAQDEEFVLAHADNIQGTGFLEHIKLPHYVDFQSELELVRRMRADAMTAKDPAT